MTTIADYLDYSPEDDQNDYRETFVYLHIPRAIVKYAEENNWLNYYDKIDNGINTPEMNVLGVKIPSVSAGKGQVTESMLPEVNDPHYTGTRLNYHTRQLAGNRNDGDSTYIENELAKQKSLKNWLIALKAFNSVGARIPDVIAGRAWNGDTTLSNIAANASGNLQAIKAPQDVIDAVNNISTQINDHTGVKPGSTFYNASSVASRGFKPLLDMISDEEVDAYRKSLKLSDEQLKQYVDEYNKAYYKPDVEDKDYENTFYGWFNKNPALRGAARYAAPWLAYGVPLSIAGSMMGNNALWAPTLLGALGMGAYGYGVGSGYLEDFSKNNPLGQMLDVVHSYANKPVGSIWSMADEGTGRVADKILSQPMTFDDREPQTNKSPAPHTGAYYNSRLQEAPNVYVQGRSVPNLKSPKPMQRLNYTPQNNNGFNIEPMV